jgi:dipeptidyl aminopeptidase/acylaminoacyl peptidase
MNRDTLIRRALEREAGARELRPDLEDLQRRFARRSRRRAAGTMLVGLAMGAISVAAALSLGTLGDADTPGDRPGSQSVVPEHGLPEGNMVIQRGTAVAVLRTGSEAAEQVANGLSASDMSADGSWILAVEDRALVAIDTHGTHRVVFMPSEGDQVQVDPRWSPDGSMIAFSTGSQDPADRSTLCLVVFATGEDTCFPDAGRVYSLDWSPDGGSIVAAGPPSQPVYRVDVATAEVSAIVGQEGNTAINRELESRGWGRSMQLVGPVWSPSGRYLAALANMEEGPYSYVPVVFTADGGVVQFGRPSTEFPQAFAWSPVGDALAYTQGEAPYRITEVYLLDPTTGTERRLVTSGGEKYPHVTDMAWSPTGRWLALTLWWAEGGYPEEAIRIIDIGNPQELEELEIDTAEVTSPLVGWGP